MSGGGRSRASWLQQVDRHLKEIGMGQASAWGMDRRRPWNTGGKWMQRRAALAHAPVPDLTCKKNKNKVYMLQGHLLELVTSEKYRVCNYCVWLGVVLSRPS